MIELKEKTDEMEERQKAPGEHSTLNIQLSSFKEIT